MTIASNNYSYEVYFPYRDIYGKNSMYNDADDMLPADPLDTASTKLISGAKVPC